MFYDPQCGLSWQMFHVSLRRMCILLLLDEVSCTCKLDQVNVLSTSAISLLTLYLLDVSVTDGGV